MAEWNARRLSALLTTDIDNLTTTARREGKEEELENLLQEVGKKLHTPANKNHVNLKVVTQHGNAIHYKCKQTSPLQNLMHAFCNRQGVGVHSVRFIFDGNLVIETQVSRCCCRHHCALIIPAQN